MFYLEHERGKQRSLEIPGRVRDIGLGRKINIETRFGE